MFSRFVSNVLYTNRVANPDTIPISKKMPNQLNELISECGGMSFCNSLYRIHTLKTSYYWESLITDYFVNYKNSIIPFGFDWMGRQFAVDINNSERLLLFDPATAEDFQLNENIITFHNETLVDNRLITLAEDDFLDTIKFLKKDIIDFDECIGFKKPLFLGGDISKENYEVIDLEVYWTIEAQIYNQLKNLPPGTKINKVTLE